MTDQLKPLVIRQLGPATPVRFEVVPPAGFNPHFATWFWSYAIPTLAVKTPRDLRAATCHTSVDPYGAGGGAFQLPR